MKKRFIALLLCCVMLLTLSPSLIASAAADDETVQQVEQTSEAKDTDQQPEQQPDQAQNEDKNETQATEEPKTEEPMPEEPKTEEPKTEEPKAEEPKAEDETTIPAAEQSDVPVESEIITPTVNFTNVAPFLAPVTGASRQLSTRGATTFALAKNDPTDSGDNGVVLNKTATANSDGTYTITLEAYATGASSVTLSQTPADIVLVLDQSGSMSSKMGNTSRLNALKAAVNSFISEVSSRSTGTVNHRIAIVGFASTAGYWGGYNNTEILSTQNVVNYDSASSNDYKNALVNVNETEGQINSRLTNAINRLDADGDTYSEYGLDMAKKIFDYNPLGQETRSRVVVMFTDGYTAPSGTDDFKYSMANNAIGKAKALKDAGVTVYTVGVFDGAQPTLDINSGFKTDDGWYDSFWGGSGNNLTSAQENVAANRYMHYVSSNYPQAQDLNNGGTLSSNASPFDGGKSYYLSASDASELNNIFQKISQEVGGSTTELDATATIKDIVSPYFTMPANATDINVYTAESDSSTSLWKARQKFNGTVILNTTDNSVSVSGFSFKDNWCGTHTENGQTTFHNGKKLIIEFTVQPKADFLGGNNVPTNGTDSGVYDKDGSAVESFPVPTVNVPIENVTVTATDKNVYLLGDLTAAQLKEGATVKVGDVPLDLSADNYGLEAWQTEYVNITVEVKDKGGNAVTSLTNLREDTTYAVAVTVAPKYAGTGASGEAAEAKSGANDPAQINVFKPELTFKDSEVYYGDTAPDCTGNLTQTKWKHGTTEADTSKMGPAPTLSLTYTPDSTKIADGKINTKQDIAVDVTVKIGETDVTDMTTFQHTNCTGKTCTVPEGKEFLLHVKTCQLTITKTGGTDGEPYVFNVYRNGSKYSEVTIVGNGSETICELPVGTYTIEEDTGWSWRFTPTIGGGVTLSKDNASNTITCTNTKANDYWLNGFSTVVKNIFGVARVEQ